jgi:hypothetical protein
MPRQSRSLFARGGRVEVAAHPREQAMKMIQAGVPATAAASRKTTTVVISFSADLRRLLPKFRGEAAGRTCL